MSELEPEELKKVASSKAQAAGAKLWVAAAKARLAIMELEVLEPRIVQQARTEPEACMVLALPSRAPAAQTAGAAGRGARRGRTDLCFGRGVFQEPPSKWKVLIAIILVLLSFPWLGKVPGYMVGWCARVVTSRVIELMQNFTGTFGSVFGDLAVELADVVTTSAAEFTVHNGPRLGSFAMAALAWMLLRRS